MVSVQANKGSTIHHLKVSLFQTLQAAILYHVNVSISSTEFKKFHSLQELEEKLIT